MYAVDSPSAPSRPPAPPGPKSGSHVRRKRRSSTGAGKTPYLLALPALLMLAILLGYPLVRMIILSFQDLKLRQLFQNLTPPFVGLDNYTKILGDDTFWAVVLRTVEFTV
ncbi:MAG: N,N-diacetylchitobiose transport system permease protein, partial [Actinoplanes sp.]|nr:N,N-diacetylchitobiose transport system permease protein [Actinoplanes sp.]